MIIFDKLNADCWNAVLDFVPFKDIVRSERVNRQWRDIILQYLSGKQLALYLSPQMKIRKCILCDYNSRIITQWVWHPNKKRFLNIIQLFIMKFGASIVSAHSNERPVFKSVVKNCPNLDHLMIVGASDYENNFNRELFNRNCLGHKNLTNLKSICFLNCFDLDLPRLISVAKNMTGLTRLDLDENHDRIMIDGLDLLLKKLPNLEEFNLSNYGEIIDLGNELIEAICRLPRLKHLGLSNNANVCDKWLELLGLKCKELRSLDISCCDYVTARGISALCKGRSNTLTMLSLAHNRRSLTEDQLIACVGCCPNLSVLDVTSIADLSSRLPKALAAQPRAQPLRLLVEFTKIPRTESDKYPGIIIDFERYSEFNHRRLHLFNF